MRKTLKVLLYGDVDLNFIDGSAIWLTSVARVLNKDKNIKVDVLLKAAVKNSALVSELEGLAQVNIIKPYEKFEQFSFENRNRMQVNDAVKVMELLDAEKGYDCIIVRGFALTEKLLSSSLKLKTIPYFTDFKHKKEDVTKSEQQKLIGIYNAFPHLFVQTKQSLEYLKDLLRVNGEKYVLMSPMIPDYCQEPKFTNVNSSMVYAGKFAKEWYTEELLEIFEQIVTIDNTLTLNIAGDKFQGELIPKKEEIIKRLKQQIGINWTGALSRTQSLQLIKNSDLGFAWRSEEIDNEYSLELSTKLLEYGQLGKPVLLRRTKMHEELLGKDYELFVETKEELISKTLEVMYDRKLYRKTAKKVYEACKQFTFTEAYKRLSKVLWSFNNQKTKLLFAGHDLKFLKMTMDYFNDKDEYEVKIDSWLGHNKHNEDQSKECLEWADIIFCEWGLGNTVWYSQNKKEDQKLFVRMHQQERKTIYPEKFKIENIDKVIAISPYIYEEFHRVCKIPREKMVIIHNAVDTDKFNLPKSVGKEELKFNLGICGILPSMKRLDRALDILEKLWNKDKRYTLYVKSKLPKDLPWIMNREEEKNYYDSVFDRIKNAPWGKNVIFDEHGNDMEQWFRKIGYILSTSDYESFHLAPMEGMAAGSIPLVLHWPGAETIYPKEYLFDSIDSIVNYILNMKDMQRANNNIQAYPKRNFDLNKINKEIESLISEIRMA